jgi:putative transposase
MVCKQTTAGQWTASRASLTPSTRPILRPTVQTCIVHLVRCQGFRGPTGATVPSNFLNVCGWKDRKNVANDLRRIYQATDDGEAEKALADFEAEWGQKYPSIAPSWRRAWEELIPFFAFPPAVRKIIHTTNAIESLNRVIRKTTRTRGSFPTDDAATKLIYLTIRSFETAGRCVREWPLTHASMYCR